MTNATKMVKRHTIRNFAFVRFIDLTMHIPFSGFGVSIVCH